MPATAAPPSLTPQITTPAAAGGGGAVDYAFAFELTGVKNENMMCPIDQHQCRGRWEGKHLIGQTPDERFSELPTLPGLVFIINTRKREVRRFDPLILPDNARLLKIAQRVMLSITNAVPSPERGRLWKECDDDFMKTFVYWWWKLVGCRRARIVRGKYPQSIEAIRAMPGLVQGQMYDQSQALAGGRSVPNELLKWHPPSEDDYANREPEGVEELPDPFIDVPTDPSIYLDRPAAVAPPTHVTGGRRGASAADILMSGGLGGPSDIRDDEPDVAERV